MQSIRTYFYPKGYELVNHLGNVRAVFSDFKIGLDTDNNGSIDNYSLDVESWGDYYPFVMPISSRTFIAQEYRFGFNGMEKDPEITGQEGSHYTAAFWEYDSRIGRRWNVDPAYQKYPFQSNYSTFNGNPILYADPTGLWGVNKAYRKHRRANRRIESKNLNRDISDVKYDKETGEYGFTISPGGSHYISSTKTKGTDFNVTPTITAYTGKFVYENKGLNAWIPKVKFSETKAGKGLQKADEVALKETQKDVSNGTYHTPNALCKSVGELTILVSGTNVIYNWTKKENIYGQEVSTGEAIKNTIFLPVDLIKFVPSEVKNAGIQIGIGIIGTNLTFPKKKDNE